MMEKRLLEYAAMMMIGDGALSVVDPKRHARLWTGGPRVWRKMLRPFVRHPEMTRWMGAAAVVAGVWLAQRQRRGCCGRGA
jgi:hypothetical protein